MMIGVEGGCKFLCMSIYVTLQWHSDFKLFVPWPRKLILGSIDRFINQYRKERKKLKMFSYMLHFFHILTICNIFYIRFDFRKWNFFWFWENEHNIILSTMCKRRLSFQRLQWKNKPYCVFRSELVLLTTF